MPALITPFTLKAVADGPDNTQVELVQQVQLVSVPVFEFGIFSNNDLDFFAGPNFDFGGRVATNGNLYLAEGNGSTLTLPAIVTAYGNVVRGHLENGWSTSSNYNGTVDIDMSPGNYRALAQSEESSNSNWPTIAGYYNGNLLSSTTKASRGEPEYGDGHARCRRHAYPDHRAGAEQRQHAGEPGTIGKSGQLTDSIVR